MSNKEKQTLFLNHLVGIYLENPDLPINSSTIYHELRNLSIDEEKISKIAKGSLLTVQVKLNNKYKNNKSVHSFSNGYYWVIENRNNKNDEEFYNSLANGFKLYIPLEAKNVYDISLQLIEFVLKEKIIMQCKISKVLSNEALIIRLSLKEDILKVSDYLNDILKSPSKIQPNPFVNTNKNIGLIIDGNFEYSYTWLLSSLIANYLCEQKKENILNESSIEGLSSYIEEELHILKKSEKEEITLLYGIKSTREYKDLIMVMNLILKSINDKLTLEELFKCQSQRLKDKKDNSFSLYKEKDKEKVLYIVNKLTYHYNIEEVHDRIMKYIQTGEINLFTRKDSIRQIISKEKFLPNKLKEIISEMGWNALVSAAKETNEKYGKEQVIFGINTLINNHQITGFTNDNNTRSYLGLIIPLNLLIEVIEKKVKEANTELTPDSITSILVVE